MTEPVTLKMLENGQLCDSGVDKQGGGVSERKRLHKGHRSCLTVSTIIPQQRTCTAAPLLWAWMAFVTGGGAAQTDSGRFNKAVQMWGALQNGTLHSVTYCTAEGGGEKMERMEKRSPAVPNGVISCPPPMDLINFAGSLCRFWSLILPLRWHFTSLEEVGGQRAYDGTQWLKVHSNGDSVDIFLTGPEYPL